MCDDHNLPVRMYPNLLCSRKVSLKKKKPAHTFIFILNEPPPPDISIERRNKK